MLTKPLLQVAAISSKKSLALVTQSILILTEPINPQNLSIRASVIAARSSKSSRSSSHSRLAFARVTISSETTFVHSRALTARPPVVRPSSASGGLSEFPFHFAVAPSPSLSLSLSYAILHRRISDRNTVTLKSAPSDDRPRKGRRRKSCSGRERPEKPSEAPPIAVRSARRATRATRATMRDASPTYARRTDAARTH